MAVDLRKTGISFVGDIPWGAHFCCFYDTKEDLLDVLVPYFKTGLENGEFCLWVISNSELLTAEEALSALRGALPDLDRYLADRSLEIVGHDDWFLSDAIPDLHKVAGRFKEKVTEALARGYPGMRVNGSPAWLQSHNAEQLREFEQEADRLFSKLRILASCTYPLVTMEGNQVFDTVSTHQFAIARRRGVWEVVETPELRQARSEIERLNNELQRFKERPSRQPFVLRYGVAVFAVTAGSILILWIRSQVGPGSTPGVAVFLCAVMFSAWFAGLKPGLLATALALLAFEYFFASPFSSFALDVREIPRLLIFALSALFVLSLTAAQRSAAESLRRAREMLEETVQELRRSNQALRKENAERKRAEALLHAKEQEFRAIVENAPDQIIRYDRNFRRVYINPAVAEAYGLQREALIGEPMGSVISDAGLAIDGSQVAYVREQIAAVFDTGKSSEFELSWPLLNGPRHLSVRLFPELDVQGAVINVLGITRDVTERKQAEEGLRQSEDRLRLVINTIPIMTWSVQPDGVVDFVNQRWFDYSGLTWEQFVQDPAGLIHPEDKTRVVEQWGACMTAGEPYEAEMRLQRADGEYRWFLVRVAPLRNEQGKVIEWYGVSADIEDLKRAEERIKATSEQLRALSARLQSAREEEDIRIAREIHDEMGSTLTSLRWELERMDKSIAEAEDQSQLQSLSTRIKDMMRLTDITINTMRRVASELRPSILDDLGLVAAVEWQADQFQERTGIVCRCDCSIDCFCFDPEQSTAIFRIFQEALTNVMRHANATAVDVLMREENGEFVLTISDNGKGITENEKSGTLSLGILGMRERAHLIGAELDINGVEGRGTVITVRLPSPTSAWNEL
jgi:PAS domain S-box-containing protein